MSVAIFKGKLVKFLAKAGLLIPSRAQTDRSASPTAGELAHNSTSGKMEVYQGSAWQELVTTEGTQTINGIKSIEDKLNFTDASIVSSSFESITNINSLTYQKRFNVSAQETGGTGIFFSSDGLKMFVIGTSGYDVNEYALSTAWDIATATYTTVSTTITQDTLPNDLYVRSDGTKLYMIGDASNTVYQYTLSTPWSISTATYDSILFSVVGQESTPTGIHFSSDGSKMFICGQGYDGVTQYNLSTAWNVSTATLGQQFSIATYEAGVQSIRFNDSGTIMYLLGVSKDAVYSYSLGTAWDISAPTLIGYHSVYLPDYSIGIAQPLISSATGLFVSNNNVYIICSSNDAVFQYDATKPSLIISGQDLIVKSPIQIQNNLLIAGSTKIDGSFTSDGTITTSGDVSLAGGDLIMSSTTNNIGYTSTATNTLNISTGAVVSGSTKTINIGPNATSGSTTNITLGSAVPGALNTATVYGDMTVSGNLTVNGTTTTINTATLEVEDQNILVNKGGTDATAGGSGLTVQGTSAPIATFQYDSTLASKWKLGAAGSESEVIIASTNQTIAGSKRFIGELVFGDTTTRPYYLPGYATNYTNDIQSVGTSFSVGGSWLPIAQYSTSTTISGGAFISLNKSNNAVVGSHTIVNSGQRLGAIGWAGSDGSKFAGAADIAADVDATPAAGSIPGRLMFYTTPSGSTVGTERLRIDSTGKALFANDVEVSGKFITGKTQLTCSAATAGAVTVTKSYHTIAGFGSPTPGNSELATINGGVDGMRLVIRAASNTVDITVKHNTGNIFLDGTDFVMNNEYDLLELIYDSTLAKWIQLARSNNGA